MRQNQFCTLNTTLAHSGHWYDDENRYNFSAHERKPCGAVGDVLTQNDKRHFFSRWFCLSCPTKFGKSVLQLYEESKLLEGYEEKSLPTFFWFLKPLLLNMEFDDNDVGSEPSTFDRLIDVEKLCYREFREANPSKFDSIQNQILTNIEANKK